MIFGGAGHRDLSSSASLKSFTSSDDSSLHAEAERFPGDSISKKERQSLIYLEDNKIFDRMDQILTQVLKERPNDPERLILAKLRKWDVEDGGDEESISILNREGKDDAGHQTGEGFHLFNPQMKVLAEGEQKRLEQEQEALNKERERAMQSIDSKKVEGKQEKDAMSQETHEIKRITDILHTTPHIATQTVMEKVEPFVSLQLLRHVVALGLVSDDSKMTKERFRLYQHHTAEHTLPLNHGCRISFSSPISVSSVPSLTHRLASHVQPLQAPLVCYVASHHLLLSYSLSQGTNLMENNIPFLDTTSAAYQCESSTMKGAYVILQFRSLLRMCHLWLSIMVRPVHEWSRLLHSGLYYMVGYEGLHLNGCMFHDLSEELITALLPELRTAIRADRICSSVVQRCAALCIKWMAHQTECILDELSTKDDNLFEEGALESMRLSDLFSSVLGYISKTPAPKVSSFPKLHPDPSTINLRSFNDITENDVESQQLLIRGSICSVTSPRHLVELIRFCQSNSLSTIADRLDIFSFCERDDLTLLAALFFRCSSRDGTVTHMSDVSHLSQGCMEQLYLRSRMVKIFADGMLLLQLRSALRILSSNVIYPTFYCPSLLPIVAKGAEPNSYRPTILQTLVKRFGCVSEDVIEEFMGVVMRVMAGQGGLQRSMFQASVSGFIVSNYVELVHVLTTYMAETESASVTLLYAQWNRLIRHAVFSIMSLCIYHRIQSFSEALKSTNTQHDFAANSIGQSVTFFDGAEIDHLNSSRASSDHIDGSRKTGRADASENQQQTVETFTKTVMERELFAVLQQLTESNTTTGVFLDVIQNPVVRQRLTGQESCFMVQHWDYVTLGMQFKNPNMWFEELTGKIAIAMKYDISPDEAVRMTTLPLAYAGEVVESIEKKVKASGFNPVTQTHSVTIPQAEGSVRIMGSVREAVVAEGSITLESSNAQIMKQRTTGSSSAQDSSQQEIFDLVVSSYASFSHILGTVLNAMHTSEIPSFIFKETGGRWGALTPEQCDAVVRRSLPVDSGLQVIEHSRDELKDLLQMMFSGRVSMEVVKKLIVSLFKFGILPCHHFDFFTRLQQNVYMELGSQYTPPYFTYLSQRLIKYAILNSEHQLVNGQAAGDDMMLDAWEEFLRDPSSVFEATRAIVDLTPRSIFLENDVALLREKLRTAPQKYIQMFSSRVEMKEIMTTVVWIRLHPGIPSYFIEAMGVTLLEVFLAGYDSPYTLHDHTKLILRLDRAFRNIMFSGQPQVTSLEKIGKEIDIALRPAYKLSRQQNLNTSQSDYTLDDEETEDMQHLRGNQRGGLLLTNVHLDPKRRSTVDAKAEAMTLFDRLSEQKLYWSTPVWRCHGLSVHLVEAVTSMYSYSQVHYADASLLFLKQFCLMLHYVTVDSYISYLSQLITYLLGMGYTPSLIQCIVDRFFETLRSFDVKFDPSMQQTMTVVLSVVQERSHDEVHTSEVLLQQVNSYVTEEGYATECTSILQSMIPVRLHLYRSLYFNLDANGATKTSPITKDATTPTTTPEQSTFNNTTEVPTITVEESTETVEKTQAMMKSTVSEIYFLLSGMVRIILGGADNPAKLRDALLHTVQSNRTAFHGLHMLLLLSSGYSRVGFSLFSTFTTFIQKNFLRVKDVGAAGVMVWSRAVSVMASLIEEFHHLTFDIGDWQTDGLRALPRDITKVKTEPVFQALLRLECSLYPNRSTQGVYWCGGTHRYYSELASVLYACLLDRRDGRDNLQLHCHRLHSRLEGGSEDVMIAAVCLMIAIAQTSGINATWQHKTFASIQEVHPIASGYEMENSNTRGMSSFFNHLVNGTVSASTSVKDTQAAQATAAAGAKKVTSLDAVIMSTAHSLVNVYDRMFTGQFFQLFMQNQSSCCQLLNRAFSSFHPVPYEEGYPLSMGVLSPGPFLFAKSEMLTGLVNCAMKVYPMDDVRARRIELKAATLHIHHSSRGLDRQESEDFALKESQSTSMAKLDTEAVEGKFRMLPFYMYSDIMISESVVDSFLSSGFTSSDAIRFAQIVDDNVRSKRTRSSVLLPTGGPIPDGEVLRTVWKLFLCQISQRLRQHMRVSRISISNDIPSRTVKVFMRLHSFMHIDLLKEVQGKEEFQDWYGGYIPLRPFLEEWMLPLLLRAASVVDDKVVINLTRRLRNESREQRKLQQQAMLVEAKAIEGADPVEKEEAPSPVQREEVSQGHLNTERAAISQRLPLPVIQHILIDILNPRCQSALLVILGTIVRSTSLGHVIKHLLFQHFYYQLLQQRLQSLNSTWLLSEQECSTLRELWKTFRQRDQGPGGANNQRSGEGNLARELTAVMEEPMEFFVQFLDQFFFTQLKFIFQWNSPPAALCAMFVYTDTAEFNRALYYLHSRWCLIAITICNSVFASGVFGEEAQLMLLLRTLRGVSHMKLAVEEMRNPRIQVSYAQYLPYQFLLDLVTSDEMPRLAISSVPSNVNTSVVESSVYSLLESMRQLLLSMRSVQEHYKAATGAKAVVLQTDLLQLFTDWANTNCSMGKDATRASYRGLVLLFNTAINAIRPDHEDKEEESPFTRRCGMGKATISDHLRLFFLFSMTACNGLRELVKDEHLISTANLPPQALKEIQVRLPTVLVTPGGDVRRPSMISDHSLGKTPLAPQRQQEAAVAPLTQSRSFMEMCAIAALAEIMKDEYVSFTQSRISRLAESEMRERFLEIIEVAMHFVVGCLSSPGFILNTVFHAQRAEMQAKLSRETMTFEEIALVCYYLLREIQQRGRLQLSSGLVEACESLLTVFCRSVYGFFYTPGGERCEAHITSCHSQSNHNASLGSPGVSSPGRSVERVGPKSMSTMGSSLSFYAASVAGGALFPSIFVKAQYRISSGEDMDGILDQVARWEASVRQSHSDEFPCAALRIFFYIWVSRLSNQLRFYMEALPLFLRVHQELTHEASNAEEFRTVFLFLHRMAFYGVAQDWMCEEWVEHQIQEYLNANEEGGEAGRMHLMRVSSVAMFAITSTVKQQRHRRAAQANFRHSSMHSLKASGCSQDMNTRRKMSEPGGGATVGGPLGSRFASSASGAGRKKSVFGSTVSESKRIDDTSPLGGDDLDGPPGVVAFNAITVSSTILQSWYTSIAYLSRKIAEHGKALNREQRDAHIGAFLSHQANAATQAEVEVMQSAIVVESSLYRSSLGNAMDDVSISEMSSQLGERTESSLSFGTAKEGRRESATPLTSAVNSPSAFQTLRRVSIVPTAIITKQEKKRKAKERDRENHPTYYASNGGDNDDDLRPKVVDGFVSPEDLVAAHTPECTWTAINGIVYDLTNFVNRHPGGATSLIQHCAGQDCTEVFLKQHLGQEKVLQRLEPLRIGVLREM